MPGLMMMALVSEESLARDRHTESSIVHFSKSLRTLKTKNKPLISFKVAMNKKPKHCRTERKRDPKIQCQCGFFIKFLN